MFLYSIFHKLGCVHCGKTFCNRKYKCTICYWTIPGSVLPFGERQRERCEKQDWGHICLRQLQFGPEQDKTSGIRAISYRHHPLCPCKYYILLRHPFSISACGRQFVTTFVISWCLCGCCWHCCCDSFGCNENSRAMQSKLNLQYIFLSTDQLYKARLPLLPGDRKTGRVGR